METKNSLRTEARDARSALYKANENARNERTQLLAAHAAEIDSIIDSLGIREAYPDVTTTKKGTRHVSTYGHGYTSYRYAPTWTYEPYEYEVTDYGRDRFVKDVKAAGKAKKGAAAAARLGAAIKAAK